jgi:S1-C subfamily serine protease
MIDEVTAGGPAAKAGISAHDIIVAIDGAPVHSLKPIFEALGKHKPGEAMQLTIVRGPQGTVTDVTMTLGASPMDPSRPYMGLSVSVYMLLVPGG